MNDLLPSSYNGIVAEDTVVVLEMATGGITSIGLYVSWNRSNLLEWWGLALELVSIHMYNVGL